MLAVWDAEINRQAALIGYLNDFRVMMICSLVLIPLLFLMRRPPLIVTR
jgi:DHA2 family multidrug resistance protein